MEKYSYNNTVRFGCKELGYWDFSNMSHAYKVNCCGYTFPSSEHLFYALRFSGSPQIQEKIINHKLSSLLMKQTFRGAKYNQYKMANWDDVAVGVMRYIIKLKYEQNKGFRDLLDSTKGKIIIEDTTKQSDAKNNTQIWGAVDESKRPLINALKQSKKNNEIDKKEFEKQLKEILIADGDCLVGRNELGKILMEIRDNKTINYNFKHKVFLMDTEIV